ncbi:hypothetical protein AB6A40_007366, partial [Gnathostoma spinigerum]
LRISEDRCLSDVCLSVANAPYTSNMLNVFSSSSSFPLLYIKSIKFLQFVSSKMYKETPLNSSSGDNVVRSLIIP